MVTRLRNGESRFRISAVQEIFHSPIHPGPLLDPPTSKVHRGSIPEGKTAERKAGRSSDFFQFMNKRSYTSSPPTYRRGCAGATLSFTSRQNHINYLEQFRRKEVTLFLYFLNRTGGEKLKSETG
jgi:hypothetical protein